jgi:prophage maintenance system killer protein
VCNRAFSDGNKRTALIATDVFPQLSGAYIDESDEEEIFSIVIPVATHELVDAPVIAERLVPLVRPLH